MNSVKIGVVGCGFIARLHIEATISHPEVEIAAVADINEEAANKLADDFDIKKRYYNVEQLLEDVEVEAVLLALPTGIRKTIALKALAAGKHILIEKPPGMSVHELDEMIAIQGELVAACCSSRFRCTPSAEAATQFIASGRLGTLRTIQCRNLGAAKPPTKEPLVWQYRRDLNGGGVLADWGVYDLDYLLGLTGWTLQPQSILGKVWSIGPEYTTYIHKDSNAETHASARITYEDGIVFTFERASHTATLTSREWSIHGSHGSLYLDMLTSQGKKLIFAAASREEGVIEETIWEGEESWEYIFGGPLLDFARSIRDRRSPLTSLEHARVIQQVIDGIYASSEMDRPVYY
jgi:predicted dehydrogenase